MAAFRPVTVHAADPGNLREGGAQVIDCASCVAGRRVGYIGGPNTLAIPVRNIPHAGERTLTITYETSEPRTLKVAVGSAQPHTVTVSGAGSLLIPARITIRVWLPSGDSWIRFFNDAGSAPDLDTITLS
ncbi:carbohydrate-binding protein [Hamadaea tsunoensis]|uniref:hypothetical protein n=1 Tax=Hamadaea tsunoensis TaxID=53368 RepID=UPI00041FC798|nr:hypothetical protein [Hamadaea tsunoensis]